MRNDMASAAWKIESRLVQGMIMQLMEAIAGRRSVRAYRNDPVPEAMLRRLIGAAILAPNAVNEQPWTFTVLRDHALLTRISNAAKSHMLASLGEGGASDHFRPRLEDPEFHIFYHAPALILISARSEGPWIVEDCALAAENLMLAAFAEGLGTCWIGFAQSYLGTAEGKALSGAAEASRPIAPIVVGWPEAATPPVARYEPEIRWLG